MKKHKTVSIRLKEDKVRESKENYNKESKENIRKKLEMATEETARNNDKKKNNEREDKGKQRTQGKTKVTYQEIRI